MSSNRPGARTASEAFSDSESGPSKLQATHPAPPDAHPEVINNGPGAPKQRGHLIAAGTNAVLPPPDGIMSRLVAAFHGPNAAQPQASVEVDPADFTNYFNLVYDTILNELYPAGAGHPNALLTQAQFVTVCKWAVKQRLDFVSTNVGGVRPVDRIAINTHVRYPRSIINIINELGAIHVLDGAIHVYPVPPPVPPEQANYIRSQVTAAMLSKFVKFVDLAHDRGCVNVGNISTRVEGTSWWLLACVTIDDYSIDAAFGAPCQICSCFREFTPADEIMAAIVHIGTNGDFPCSPPHYLWYGNQVVDTRAIAMDYALRA